MDKHTPEPWVIDPRDNDIRSSKGDWLIASLGYGLPKNATEANAARIVACVNACAGLIDPEVVLKCMRAVTADDLDAEAIGKLKLERDELLRLVTLFKEDYERFMNGSGESHPEDIYSDVCLYFKEKGE